MVMTTFWTFPTKVFQFAETGAESTHIPWKDLEIEKLVSTNKINVGTNGSLYHIARSPKHDLITKTYFIKLSGFNFQNLPGTISGIEMRLNSNRRGRIVDDLIQLMYEDTPIGTNQASIEINPTKIYGAENNLWESNVTLEQVQNLNFGILMRFKSHPKWPHNDPMFIDSVELRIH